MAISALSLSPHAVLCMLAAAHMLLALLVLYTYTGIQLSFLHVALLVLSSWNCHAAYEEYCRFPMHDTVGRVLLSIAMHILCLGFYLRTDAFAFIGLQILALSSIREVLYVCESGLSFTASKRKRGDDVVVISTDYLVMQFNPCSHLPFGVTAAGWLFNAEPKSWRWHARMIFREWAWIILAPLGYIIGWWIVAFICAGCLLGVLRRYLKTWRFFGALFSRKKWTQFKKEDGSFHIPDGWRFVIRLCLRCFLAYRIRKDPAALAALIADLAFEFEWPDEMFNQVKKLTTQDTQSSSPFYDAHGVAVMDADVKIDYSRVAVFGALFCVAIALALQIPYSRVRGFTMNSELKNLAQNVRDLKTMQETALPFVLECINSLWRHVTGEPKALIPSYHGELRDRFLDLRSVIVRFSAPHPEAYSAEEAGQIAVAVDKLVELELDCCKRKAPVDLTSAVRGALAHLRRKQDKSEGSLVDPERPWPIGVLIEGPPGVGKTGLVDVLVANCMPKAVKSIASGSVVQEYHDYYHGQAVVSWTEFGNCADQTECSKFCLLNNTVINTATCWTNQSQADKKDTIPWKMKLVIADTNQTVGTIETIYRKSGYDVDAFRRRYPIVCRLTRPRTALKKLDLDFADLEFYNYASRKWQRGTIDSLINTLAAHLAYSQEKFTHRKSVDFTRMRTDAPIFSSLRSTKFDTDSVLIESKEKRTEIVVPDTALTEDMQIAIADASKRSIAPVILLDDEEEPLIMDAKLLGFTATQADNELEIARQAATIVDWYHDPLYLNRSFSYWKTLCDGFDKFSLRMLNKRTEVGEITLGITKNATIVGVMLLVREFGHRYDVIKHREMMLGFMHMVQAGNIPKSFWFEPSALRVRWPEMHQNMLDLGCSWMTKYIPAKERNPFNTEEVILGPATLPHSHAILAEFIELRTYISEVYSKDKLIKQNPNDFSNFDELHRVIISMRGETSSSWAQSCLRGYCKRTGKSPGKLTISDAQDACLEFDYNFVQNMPMTIREEHIVSYPMLVAILGCLSAVSVGGALYYMWTRAVQVEDSETKSYAEGKEKKFPGHARRRQPKLQVIQTPVAIQNATTLAEPRVVVEMYPRDPNAESMAMSIAEANLKVVMHDNTMLLLLCMGGTQTVTAGHFYYSDDNADSRPGWRPDHLVTVIEPITKLKQDFRVEEIKLSNLREVVIGDYRKEPVREDILCMDLPKQFNFKRDIVRHIIPVESRGLVFYGKVLLTWYERASNGSFVMKQYVGMPVKGILARCKFPDTFIAGNTLCVEGMEVPRGSCGGFAIALNPHMPKKLIGIITSGLPGRTFVTWLTPDYFKAGMTPDLMIPAEQLVHNAETLSLRNHPMTVVHGRVPKMWTCQKYSTTSLVKGLWNDWECPDHRSPDMCGWAQCANTPKYPFPPTFAPFILDGTRVDPCMKIFTKASCNPIPSIFINGVPLFKKLKQDLRELGAIYIPPPRRGVPYFLTPEQVLNGVHREDGTELVAGIDLYPGGGLPFTNLKAESLVGSENTPSPRKFTHGKYAFVVCSVHGNIGNCPIDAVGTRVICRTKVLTRTAAEMLAEMQASIQRGEAVTLACQIHQKRDEPRDPRKFARILVAEPFPFLLIAKGQFTHVYSGVTARPYDTAYASRMNVHCASFDAWVRDQLAFGQGFKCGDRGTADWRCQWAVQNFSRWLIQGWRDAYTKWESPEERKLVFRTDKCILNTETMATLIWHDLAFSNEGRYISGRSFTTETNNGNYAGASYAGYVIHKWQNERVVATPEMYLREEMPFFCGDDSNSVITSSNTYTMDIEARILNDVFSFEVTDPYKAALVPEKMPKFYSITESQFLRRRPVFWGGHWHAALEKRSIYRPKYYMRSFGDEELVNVAHSIAIELFETGDRAAFDEWNNEVRAKLFERNINFVPKSWATLYHAWIADIPETTMFDVAPDPDPIIEDAEVKDEYIVLDADVKSHWEPTFTNPPLVPPPRQMDETDFKCLAAHCHAQGLEVAAHANICEERWGHFEGCDFVWDWIQAQFISGAIYGFTKKIRRTRARNTNTWDIDKHIQFVEIIGLHIHSCYSFTCDFVRIHNIVWQQRDLPIWVVLRSQQLASHQWRPNGWIIRTLIAGDSGQARMQQVVNDEIVATERTTGFDERLTPFVDEELDDEIFIVNADVKMATLDQEAQPIADNPPVQASAALTTHTDAQMAPPVVFTTSFKEAFGDHGMPIPMRNKGPVFEREIFLGSINWTSATAAMTQLAIYSLPGDLVNPSTAWASVNYGTIGARFGIELRVESNASPAAVGMLAFSFEPCGNPAVNKHRTTAWQRLNNNVTIATTSNLHDLHLKVPYTWPRAYLTWAELSAMVYAFGVLTVDVVAPFVDTSGTGSTTCRIDIYGRVVDLEVTGADPQAVVPMTAIAARRHIARGVDGMRALGSAEVSDFNRISRTSIAPTIVDADVKSGNWREVDKSANPDVSKHVRDKKKKKRSKAMVTTAAPPAEAVSVDIPLPSAEAAAKSSSYMAPPAPASGTIVGDIGRTLVGLVSSLGNTAQGIVSAIAPHAGEIAKGIGTVLPFFLDKPMDERPPMPMWTMDGTPWSYTRALSNVVFPNSLPSGMVSSKYGESPSFEEIARQPSPLKLITITAATANKAELALFVLSPARLCNFSRTGAGPFNYTYDHTYLSYVSSLFGEVSGDLKFMFIVTTSPMIALRLRFTFVPGDGQAPTFDPETLGGDACSRVYNVRGTMIIKFSVPILRNQFSLPTSSLTGVAPSGTSVGGWLRVTCEDPLTSFFTGGTSAPTAYIMTFVSGGDNFKCHNYIGWSNRKFGTVALESSPELVRQRDRAEEEEPLLLDADVKMCTINECFEEPFDLMHPLMDTLVHSGVVHPIDETNAIQMMKRPSYVGQKLATWNQQLTFASSHKRITDLFQFQRGGMVFDVNSVGNTLAVASNVMSSNTSLGSASKQADYGQQRFDTSVRRRYTVGLSYNALDLFVRTDSTGHTTDFMPRYGLEFYQDTYNNTHLWEAAADDFRVLFLVSPPQELFANALVSGQETMLAHYTAGVADLGAPALFNAPKGTPTRV